MIPITPISCQPSCAVDVVVPNWNGDHFLGSCLRSLRGQVFKDFRLIVVDNGSSDSSHAVVEKEFPEATWIGLEKNYGFAVACNIGIEASNSRYIALLNNDTECDRRWLAELVGATHAYPELGSFASKMLYLHNTLVLDSAGIELVATGGGRNRGHNCQNGEEFDRPMEVLGPSGGAALYSRAALDEVGTFDEDFFYLHEDFDLAMRLQLSGFRCLYVPSAIVYHVGMGSHRGSSRSVYYSIRNWLLAMMKSIPAWLLVKYAPTIFAFAVYLLLQSAKNHYLGVALRGMGDALLSVGATWQKRRKILSHSSVTTAYIDSLVVRKLRQGCKRSRLPVGQ